MGDNEKKYLAFVAIDAEVPSGSTVMVHPEDRIREAAKAISDAGLKPIVYSSSHYWNDVLGLSKVTEFSYLPLWDSSYGPNIPNPSLQASWKKGVGWVNWETYGGWEGLTGKQYQAYEEDGVTQYTLYGKPVDLDTFDPSLFTETPTSPCTPTESSTGKGTVYLDTDSGTIKNLASVNPSENPETPPTGVNLYFGLFRFDITGLTPGGSANLTLIYADNYAKKISKNYWKYGATPDNPKAHWYSIPSTISGNRQMIKIVDGGLGDDDLVANGEIKDDGGPSIDEIPQTTIATISGTLGNNGWYISDVQVNLTAIDNEGGSGVNKTEYSFDSTNWSTYTAPFNISNEGITTLYYRSIDNASNVEPTKSQAVKIDKTPSEATIRFNTTSKDIKVYNSETGGEASYVLLPLKMDTSSIEEDAEEKKEWEPSKGVELRQYTLNDSAGNSLMMVLKHKKEGNEIKVKIITTQYNGGAVLPATKNKITASYAYSQGKKAALQVLQQWITVKKQFDVWAKYNAGKGKTEITVKLEGQKPQTESKKGIVILELLTDKGGLKYKY